VLHVVDNPYQLPMSSPGPATKERADARRNRERILCAAARLIERHGVDGISMDDVAAEAGVGKGTLYRRFGERGALLRALIEEPERAFQESLIRGEPPLGPGADPVDRLHAFGVGLLDLLESHSPFIREAEGLGGMKRFTHPVYQGYRSHVGVLLRQIRGDDPQTEYLIDCLMSPLGAEPFLYQREVRGMSLDDMKAGWCMLADAVVGTARDH
jgi:AcrR family transcriptional regulator